jgi:hypothetical protein
MAASAGSKTAGTARPEARQSSSAERVGVSPDGCARAGRCKFRVVLTLLLHYMGRRSTAREAQRPRVCCNPSPAGACGHATGLKACSLSAFWIGLQPAASKTLCPTCGPLRTAAQLQLFCARDERRAWMQNQALRKPSMISA